MHLKKEKKQYLTPVFYMSLVVTLAVVVMGIISPKKFQYYTDIIRVGIGRDFGWFYLLFVTSIVLLCIFFIVNPVGQIRLGDPDSKPEHSNISWFAMLFSAGMGIGLVFWGAAEPLSHFAITSVKGNEGTRKALEDSFRYTFFHWGIHAWAVYGIIALSLAYFKFRKKEKSLISVTLKPLFGNGVDGLIGKITDSFTIFATVIGVATTLGFGASQINGGLSYLFGIENSLKVQIIIIIITTICFVLSALSGLGKGVKILSNLNMILAGALLAITIIVGPTVLILNTLVDGIGTYIQSFFRMSFHAGALDELERSWINNWTIFYWAWWISWSPFVGVFIARISKGRTIREFLSCILLIPTVLSCIWFSVFGTLSTHAYASGAHNLTKLKVEELLFGTFNHYPISTVLSVIAIVLVFSFFITSADSATFVLGMLSENGNIHPHNKTKVIWGTLLSGIAIILLMAGGLVALQNVLIIVALPFSVIIILMMVSLFIELKHEKNEMGLHIKPDTFPTKDEPFRSYED